MRTFPEPRCFRLLVTANMIRPKSRRNPRIEPMTIPAIAPPLNPLPPLLLLSLLEEDVPAVGDEVAVAVEVKTSAIDEKTGNVTS